MKKKFKIQYLRIISQIFFFIFFPGLFALAFAQIGSVVSMVVGGKANIDLVIVNLFLGLTLIVLSIIFGRFFCGWICSFGAMNDLLYYISKKVFKVKFKVSERLDRILKTLKYIVLLFIVICFWILGMGFGKVLDPWNNFAQMAKIPPSAPTLDIGLIFLIIIIIGSMLIERFFCRYLCPLGAIFSIFAKLNITKINKERSVCGSCTACTAKCSMGLALYKTDVVKEVDCINCLKCVDVCPKRNVSLRVSKKSTNAVLLTAIFLVVFFILYFIRSTLTEKLLKNYSASQNSNTSNVQKSTNTVVSTPTSNVYNDGTYYGTGQGYDSTIKVEVVVSGGKISNVKVVSIGDNPSYYEAAVQLIPSEIIKAQSPNVDVVAGATSSSMGIINGAKGALLKAIGGQGANSASEQAALTESNTINYPTVEKTATVGNSTATVKVAISGQMIESITVIKLVSPESAASEAKENIPNEILSTQSVNVTPVAGAPNSSAAIMDAVTAAVNS